MSIPEEQKEAKASGTESSSTPESKTVPPAGEPNASSVSSGEAAEPPEGGHYDDGYGHEYGEGEGEAAPPPAPEEVEQKPATAVVAAGGGSGTPPTPPPPAIAEADDEDDGMLRMSFLEHLEELRSRILKALAGMGVAFVLCLVFANELWKAVNRPIIAALKSIGADPNLVQIAPMDAFQIMWIKTPILVAIFVASPWILYQVWAFIAPGLYKKERGWAGPFVICSAGLFVLGGMFGYFVAFPFGLAFLLGLGTSGNVKPMVSMVEYFDLFVNAMLGIGLVFELPILVFFLTLLRITTPGFLMRNSRYAILIITIIAAIVTPTPDVFNLMLFAVPMCILYFLGIFASYLLVLRREDQPFPWKAFGITVLVILSIIAGVIWIMIARYNYHLVYHWPFLTR
jgi:sec-independent protein translocase protein TatC